MRDLLKAKLGIGLIAFFSTVFVVALNQSYENLIDSILIILIMFVTTIIIAYVLMTILEWVDIFDLNTNAIITLIVNITLLQAVTNAVLM